MLSDQAWDDGIQLLYGLVEQIEEEEGESLLSDRVWALISIAEHSWRDAGGEVPNEWECEMLFELLFGNGPINTADQRICDYLKP